MRKPKNKKRNMVSIFLYLSISNQISDIQAIIHRPGEVRYRAMDFGGEGTHGFLWEREM